MKKYRYTIVVLILLMCFTSCSKWLDVQPSDQVSEETAFGTLAGFKQTLNGVYIELNSDNIYGKALTCGMIEILAQQYAVNEDATSYYPFAEYDYTGANAEGQIENVWETSYNLIANVNKILENCETHRGTVLSEEYYHIIRGEALALRALLHFDLFRLFGPIYSEGMNTESIPYYDSFSLNVAPKLQAEEFMGKVISDLSAAIEELKDDPVIENGVVGKKSDNFFTNRNFRLNYYAVKALLARAYMYVGETALAAEQAQDVIDAHNVKGFFPFVESTSVLASEPDRVFSSEILFGLQNLNVSSLYSSLFDANTLKAESLLAPKAEVISQLYSGGEVDDYRFRTSLNRTAEVGGTNFSIFQKYMGGDSIYSQIIPMLRIGEMYYIKAETRLESDPEGAYQILKEFLTHRGVASPNISTPQELLDSEYKKEFFGEGQLFFYYKRLNRNSIESATGNGNITMSNLQYVLPIPDGETQYN